MQSKLNKILSVIITLCMVVSMLSGLNLTTSAEEYGLWVDGIQVTNINASDVLEDGTVSDNDSESHGIYAKDNIIFIGSGTLSIY